MPLYEYACAKCGERFEIIQKFSDAPLRRHSEGGGRLCDGALKKLLSAPAIQFKGSGWYVTDYGPSGKKPKSETETKNETKAKSEAKPKTKPKTESKSKPAAAGA